MAKITPHLWYSKEAKEAAEYYVSVFPNSKITNITTLHDTPSGDVDVVSFDLSGQPFMAISAGPLFKFNPSVNFTINCKTPEEVDQYWNKLILGGSALMPLQKWPFSVRYGWLQDKYGLSWQIGVVAEDRQKIVPSLMFIGPNFGKCEEAISFYTSVFKNSATEMISRYEPGEHDEAGKIKYSLFKLEGQQFIAMESSLAHKFAPNESVSFIVNCDTQEEIDYYWEKLSAVPESEQCGWCKDKYGFSWQVTSMEMDEMMKNADRDKLDKITQAFLQMKKIDIAKLKEAAE
jgi:predicted 3-demethylubiquinone-9 3-methyltransferase (glyoxalase superfamily)